MSRLGCPPCEPQWCLRSPDWTGKQLICSAQLHAIVAKSPSLFGLVKKQTNLLDTHGPAHLHSLVNDHCLETLGHTSRRSLSSLLHSSLAPCRDLCDSGTSDRRIQSAVRSDPAFGSVRNPSNAVPSSLAGTTSGKISAGVVMLAGLPP